MTRVLTPEQVARFDTDGYVFPVDCLSRGEAADYRARFDAYERESGASARSQLRVKAHLGFPWLTELVRDARILGAVEDVIGPDILLYLSTLWFKGPEDGNFVSWHQDSVYYGLEPHDEVTVWLPLPRRRWRTVASGCLAAPIAAPTCTMWRPAIRRTCCRAARPSKMSTRPALWI